MAILNELARGGRATFTDLAKRTGMSVPGVRDRVLRMIESGDMVVKALVNANKFGTRLAFVTIKTPDAQTAVQVVERTTMCPRALMSTTVGEFGAFVILAAPDLALLHHALNNLLNVFGNKIKYEVAYCDKLAGSYYITAKARVPVGDIPPCTDKPICKSCQFRLAGRCKGCGLTHIY